ncbi:MAG: HEPN domain-containing protein [Burkholderiales bacterium]|nr:HEPN domain-containing protein [Phycisphaerae bacterium]
MKQATREWVEKAEADFAAALLLRRSRKKHSRDIVCFHLQQCVEKYLKARLAEATISFPRIHDLERLLDLAIAVEPLWSTLRPSMARITDYAVEVRYQGRTTSAAEANTLLQETKYIRNLIRAALNT